MRSPKTASHKAYLNTKNKEKEEPFINSMNKEELEINNNNSPEEEKLTQSEISEPFFEKIIDKN